MDTDKVIKTLNRARAEELACIKLYSENAKILGESGDHFLARMFRDQMAEELMHARILGARVRELGGTPTHEPAAWCKKSHRGNRRGSHWIRNMIAQAEALEARELKNYKQAILECALQGDYDTRSIYEGIMEAEQSHEDLWGALSADRD